MALKLFTQGSSDIATTPNIDVPTNPKATTDADSAPTLSGAIFTAIYPDDSTTDTIERITSSSSLETPYSNLEVTKGFRIKCYDDASQIGIRLDTLDIENDSFEYYVLIHSDNHLKHHFAKITEIIKSDVTGDSFDFTPKLGNEIAKDTKFKLCKLPKASTAIAFSAGLSLSLRQELIVSRPHYYFRGTVDKSNQLDHNTKYFMRVRSGSGASITLDNTSDTLKSTFLTVQDYNLGLIDYSKYSLKVKMIDNLRTLDTEASITFLGDITSGSASVTGVSSIDCTTALFVGMAITGTNIPSNTQVLSIQDANSFTMSNNATGTGSRTFTTYNSNEGQVVNLPLDYQDYEDSFVNARRDGDDLLLPISNFTSTGPKRYLHYDFSPDKCNKTANVIENNIFESIGGRGAFNETKIVDAFRIMPKKVKEFIPLRVRNRLLRENSSDFVSFDWTITNISSTTITVDSSKANSHFVAGNEIKIGNYICLVNGVTTNTITLESYYRLETESQFTAGTPPITETDTIYRRRFNPYNSTILTNFKIINSRTSDLFITFIDKNFVEHYASVSSADATEKLLTISLDNTAYTNNQTIFIDGDYYIECQKFDGEIESIDSYKENGQTSIELKGRNAFSKLLSPIINSNTLFSSDIIYSSETPYAELERLKGTGSVDALISCEYNSNIISFKDSSGSSLSTTVVAGDKIFIRTETGNTKYVGTIASNSSGINGTLETLSNASTTSGSSVNNSRLPVYKQKKKEYVFNKALSNNPYVSSTTHLSGASNKGIFFNGGKTLVDGVEGTNLVGSSYDAHPDALGYHLSNVRNMKSDSYFQATLGNDANSETYQTFDTVNTLMDFNVLNVSESGANKLVELSSHIPLTLGKVKINYANTQDITNAISFASVDLGTVSGTNDSYKILTTSIGFCSTTASQKVLHGKPLYISTVGETDYAFIGFILQVNRQNTNTIICVDREVSVSIGQQLSILDPSIPDSGNKYTSSQDKLSHELNLINGGHLHTGKIISLVHPTFGDDNEPKNLDFKLNYFVTTVNTNTFYKYGESQYRLFNLEKGEIKKKKQGLLGLLSSNKDAISKQKTIPYYASGYRFGSFNYENSAFNNGLLPINKISSYYSSPINNIPIETRGKPSAGSKFFDSDIKCVGESNEVSIFYPFLSSTEVGYDESDANYINLVPYTIKEYLEIIDPSVERMFLFANSDITPYSKNKKTSLLYGNRNIQDYSIVGINSPFSSGRSDSKDDTALTESINLNDDSYSSANIFSSDKTLSSLKGFSMMRLTEVCLDWAFNQINPEMPIDRKATVPKINSLGLEFSSIGLTNITVSTTAQYEHNGVTTDILADSNANWAAADGNGHSLVAGDVIVDSNGRYIGTVAGFSSEASHTNNILELRQMPYKTNGGEYYTGNIYKVRKADIDIPTVISGKGNKDSFVTTDDNIHMLKSAFMGRGKFELKREKHTIVLTSGSGNSIDTGTSGDYILILLPKEDGTTENFFVYPVDSGSAIPSVSSSTYSAYTPISFDITGATASGTVNKITRITALYNALISNASFMSHLYSIRLNTGSFADYSIEIIPRATRTSVTSILSHVFYDSGNQFVIGETISLGHKIGYGQDSTGFTNSEVINDGISISGTFAWESGTGLGDSKDSSWFETTGETLGGEITHSDYVMHSVLPISTNIDNIKSFHPFSVFRWLANLPKNNTLSHSTGMNTRAAKWESLYKYFNIVSLGRFNIEDNVGAQAFAGISSPFIRGIFRKEYTNSLNQALYGINMFNSSYSNSFSLLEETEANTITKVNRVRFDLNPNEFASKEYDSISASNAYNTELREADGALIAFKPKLYITSAIKGTEDSQTGIGNHNTYVYTISAGNYRGNTNIAPNEYNWLNFVDLTGCYLASSRGKKYNTASDALSPIRDDTGATNPSRRSAEGTTPESLIYVLSHELDTLAATNTHKIITDKQLNASELYRLLQPNHTFSYSFSPKQIRFNELSSKYTKISNENKTYEDVLNWQVQGNSVDSAGELEGVLSMYVVVDVDKQTNSNYVVIRDPTNLSHNNNSIIDLPSNMAISDGEINKKIQTEVLITGDDIGYYIGLSESNDLKGIVSLTEPFTLSVGKDFDVNSKRCLIGSGVNICNESEDLINNLLEDENINFTMDNPLYPLFMSPDFQGIDLLTAINFILQKKNKSLVYENESFVIKDKESNDFYSNILINDSGDFQVMEFEKVKTTFDLHNEIIVYGNSHKSQRKDLRSIQKVGRKTLEVFERELVTQHDVDMRAKELLKLHSTINTKLILTLSSKGLGQLRAGDIIQVEIERENVQLSQYMVLQIEHKLSGILKLELGRFSKQLEDRFAELLISNKKTNSAIRSQKFNEKNVNFDFIENLSINELRLVIRKRVSSGGNSLGFGITLNTGTTSLGFGGGTITLTTLLDEDLA